MQPISHQSNKWFVIGIASIFLFSAILRFWQLGRFNTLVFDEVYYAKFANNYLTQTEFFNAHPPLSQYIIAIGIWIGSHLPFGQEIVNNETGSTLAAWSYRWVNALTGSFIPLVVGAIAYKLTHRWSYSLIATLLMALDGLFLVESRYALNNIYLVIFGLLAHLCLIVALQNNQLKQKKWLVLSGIFFGASTAIKWNGLGFLLGIYLLWILVWIIKFFIQQKKYEYTSAWQNLTRINLIQLILNLFIIPIITYSLLWIPHIILNPKYGFLEMQEQIFSYHQRIGSGADIHPYCAQWFTWPLMMRPVVYFYKNTGLLDKPEPSLATLYSDIISPQLNPIIFDVHAMGNPILWWFSTWGILLLILMLFNRVWHWEKNRQARRKKIKLNHLFKFPPPSEMWLLLYLVINWLSNFMPWSRVSRCTFLYHYMGALVFAILGFSWCLDRWLNSQQASLRIMGVTMIFIVLFAFVFWMPIYLGLPLSPQNWQFRMWFRSWI
ncbi:glycosyl transferase, family 39 [Trichodesmium erythraeum IMS101]|uniref:Polyprenol-phosphate-mannose--protein mannosyltransferase n=1 Tax=Trichodesmium erythraeum (strain IMS101) TaxID=203124 RepID=Q117P9_TRIEI|nr:phospholipid carrier-dependent glycosyltransferase [Trichodesmium erythraeum GBRTRLIN201]MDE5093694.1 phospholipid carrier-dependent glycosyltransferase [Trichodesmium sp. St11_bin5]